MKIWPFLSLLPLTLVLAACGGSDNDNNDNAEPVRPAGFTFYGVQGDQLVIGDTNNASRAARRTITGVNGGTIIAVDVRPANGGLYGLSSDDELYQINANSGQATQIGTAIDGLDGDRIGFDFNPTVDRIRIIDSNGQNFRVNPDTGAVVAQDSDIQGTAEIVGCAYTNNGTGLGGTTTLYGLDASQHRLVRIGGFNGNPSPNLGQVTVVGSVFTDLSGELGFDITSSNVGFYADSEDGDVRIFSINLDTGATVETSRFRGAGVDAFAVVGGSTPLPI